MRLDQTMGLLCKEQSPLPSQLTLFLEIVKHDLRKRRQLKALRLVFSLCKGGGGEVFILSSSHLLFFHSVSKQETSSFENLHLQLRKLEVLYGNCGIGTV